MPGIVGLITKMPRADAEARLRVMVETLRHESFYVTGSWIDEKLGVYLGWVARKESFNAGMPVRNESGNIVLAFSGEEFPEPGIVQSLRGRGHAVDSDGPSYLAHVAEEDRAFPRNLNGRFHGLLIDREQEKITLFIDRYGIHRIYYHEVRDAFYFGAEAKAILAVCPTSRAADPKGLAEFISCGCALEGRTIFKDIHLLPPASAWTFRKAIVEDRKTYFNSKEWEGQPPLEPETFYREMQDTFSRNLPRYFSGTEKIGMSLTGGLDSRMILARHKAPQGSLPCYTFGGIYRDCQDVIIARKVAAACGQEHSVIPVGDEFISEFPMYAERAVYLSDGCVEVNHAPDLYINKIAAGIAPVRMTGNYGGEILRQVRAFKPIECQGGIFNPDLTLNVGKAVKTYRRQVSVHPLSFAVFRQAPWHHHGLLALEESQLSVRTPFLDNDFVQCLFRAPQSALANEDLSLRMIDGGSTSLRRIRTDRGNAGTLPEWAASLQRSYFDFTFKAEFAYDLGMPQSLACLDYFLRKLHLERIFLGRHKFTHFRLWYRDALSSYVREILLDSRTLSRPYLQASAVEQMVESHLEGKKNYTAEIHKLLSLEHLHRLFLDGV